MSYFFIIGAIIILALIINRVADKESQRPKTNGAEKKSPDSFSVILYSTTDPWKAGVVKNALDEKDIRYAVVGENIATVYGSLPCFETRITVLSEDYQTARDIVSSLFDDPEP